MYTYNKHFHTLPHPLVSMETGLYHNILLMIRITILLVMFVLAYGWVSLNLSFIILLVATNLLKYYINVLWPRPIPGSDPNFKILFSNFMRAGDDIIAKY